MVLSESAQTDTLFRGVIKLDLSGEKSRSKNTHLQESRFCVIKDTATPLVEFLPKNSSTLPILDYFEMYKEILSFQKVNGWEYVDAKFQVDIS